MHRRGFVFSGSLALVAAMTVTRQGTARDMRQVGWLALVPLPRLLGEFKDGMRVLGYAEGHDYRLDERYAEAKPEALVALATELVRLNVDVIVAETVVAARAARQATRSIPIVFITGDPVASGLVQSLAHPGGNLTGVANVSLRLYHKRVEILKTALPQLRRLAVLVGPSSRPDVLTEVAREAVAAQGLEALPPIFVNRPAELEAGFAQAVQGHAGAILVTPNPFFNAQRNVLVTLAARHRLPALYEFRDFVEAGGLMCYGADNKIVYRRVASYVDRIFKGAKPADLPVEEPTKLELVINLKTAKVLGLAIPPSLLARADEVIE